MGTKVTHSCLIFRVILMRQLFALMKTFSVNINVFMIHDTKPAYFMVKKNNSNSKKIVKKNYLLNSIKTTLYSNIVYHHHLLNKMFFSHSIISHFLIVYLLFLINHQTVFFENCVTSHSVRHFSKFPNESKNSVYQLFILLLMAIECRSKCLNRKFRIKCSKQIS